MDDVENTVLRLFDQYTGLEDREAASLAPEVIRVAKTRVADEIMTLLSDTATSQLFLDKTDAAISFEADMALVAATKALDEFELDTARNNAPRDAKMGQVALRFLTKEQTDESGQTDQTETTVEELPILFQGEVQQVSERLVGKQIHYGEAKILVASTLAQNREDNKRWLASRPLFGKDPVDVYVASYRGNPMLFLRASETDSCVRISTAIDPESSEKFLNPKQVCDALGLKPETVGHTTVRDNVITIHIDGERTKN